jgi:hypothetical protein
MGVRTRPGHGYRSPEREAFSSHELREEISDDGNVLLDALLHADSKAVVAEQVAELFAVDELDGRGAVAGRLVGCVLREGAPW